MHATKCLQTGQLALWAWLVAAGAAGAAAEPIVAEGWASLGGRTEQEARLLAEQRAYHDLRDRVEGVAFFWSPATGARLLSRGDGVIDQPPYGAKVTRAGRTSFGLYHVQLSADAPADSPLNSMEGRTAAAMASEPPSRDLDRTVAAARAAALQDAIGQTLALHFAVKRLRPGMTPGRAFPVGPYNLGVGKDKLLLAVSVKVGIGDATSNAPRSARNVLIQVANASAGGTFRQTGGVRMKYRDSARFGAGKMGKHGLNTKFRAGDLSGRIHASQERHTSSGGGAMTIMVQDGTTGYLDVGTWMPMALPYKMGGIDPRTGKPVQHHGTMPLMTHTGARLAVRAVILDDGRIRITARPEHASLGGRGVHVAGTAQTVTTRDGQPVSIAGLAWRQGGRSGSLSSRRTSGSMTLILTPHIR